MNILIPLNSGKSIMANISAMRVSLEEMKLNETPKRKRVSASNKPYTYVFGHKVYISTADLQIYIDCHFEIHF